jgi:uncharacterized RDD family membrane protein YckC
MENRIGFGRRLGAFLLDLVFIIGLSFILASLMNEFLQNFVNVSEEEYDQVSKLYGNFTDTMLAITVAVSIVSFLYNLVEGFTGFTAGKLLLGIQVGNVDGKKANLNQLMTRFAIKNIGTIIGLIGIALTIKWIGSIGNVFGFIILIGCFFVLSENKLAFQDMLAKTAVFKKSDIDNSNTTVH